MFVSSQWRFVLDLIADVPLPVRTLLAVCEVVPVPPLFTAIVEAFQVPVPIVPSVVILVVPAQVDSFVFSTLDNPTFVFDMFNQDGSE